jgi:hypothetical protein
MKEMGAEVLAGRAKSVSARHYLLNELDLISEQYRIAWKTYHTSLFDGQANLRDLITQSKK